MKSPKKRAGSARIPSYANRGCAIIRTRNSLNVSTCTNSNRETGHLARSAECDFIDSSRRRRKEKKKKKKKKKKKSNVLHIAEESLNSGGEGGGGKRKDAVV